MSAATYTRYELLRTFRNRRFVIFSLGFPLVLYFLIAAPNRNESTSAAAGSLRRSTSCVGLAAFGTMSAMLSSGARIAGERQVGWNRQLRITPLTTRNYFRAKVVTGYAMAAHQPAAALRRRRHPRRLHGRERLGPDDPADLHRPDPVRRGRDPASGTC